MFSWALAGLKKASEARLITRPRSSVDTRILLDFISGAKRLVAFFSPWLRIGPVPSQGRDMIVLPKSAFPARGKSGSSFGGSHSDVVQRRNHLL